jgi:malate synthase
VRVGIGYMEGWIRDIGCVAWDNLMEDLATLEISRAQTWQWMHHQIKLDDGPNVTPDFVRKVFREELDRIVEKESAEFATERGASRQEVIESFETATREAEAIFTQKDFREFLYMESEPVG